jgi:hypothetical protein
VAYPSAFLWNELRHSVRALAVDDETVDQNCYVSDCLHLEQTSEEAGATKNVGGCFLDVVVAAAAVD